jgi:5-methylthioadenosine/S-adenosylhomocysteine deaminase
MCKEYSDNRVRFCLALPNARCIKASTFPILTEFANDLEAIISIHILESTGDNKLTNDRYGKPVVQYLDEIGFLNEKILSIHSIYLSEEDIRTFANNSVAVSYNPVSNMYLGDGVAPVVEFLKQGLRVGIGTDGAASNNSQDMLEAIKSAVLLQRVSAANPEVLLGRDGFRMATIDGARSIGLDHLTGSLEAGKKADILLTNFHQSKSTPYFDPINTLVFSAAPSVIETVIIDGEVVLEEGRFTKIDEQSIIEEAQTAAHQLAIRTYDSEIIKNCVAIQAPT